MVLFLFGCGGAGNSTNTVPPATAQTFSISGTISGSGGNGATVTLSGAASATTTANSSGSYSFTGLANGTYAVTPSNSGFDFSPTAQSVTVSGSNMTVAAFTATTAPPTFSISGTITPATTGSGATVTLSGSASATTTANSSGVFSFTGLVNGAYIVTPSSTSAVFSPTSQSVTISSANGSTSFTATALVLHDDFTSSSIDTTKWYPMNQFGYTTNSELQCYLPAQDTIANGMLVLTTIASHVTCPPYGGGSTQSSSYASGELYSAATFLFGTIEYRAQMTGGQGAWPAIWMLGHNCHPSALGLPGHNCNWPQPGSDEIDITEILNQNVTSINQEVHSSLGSPQCVPTGITDVTKNFHVYDLIWTSALLTWKIDGLTTCTTTQAIPQQAMFLIMNNAVGGNGGGGTINNTTMPWNMYVDYVKITQP